MFCSQHMQCKKCVCIINDSLYYVRSNPASVTGSRKASDWNCAEQIANHLSKTMDLTEWDLQMQLYRYVTHMLFTTACSQFNSDLSYKEIKEGILDHIKIPYYDLAIRKSKFKAFSKGWMAKVALEYKQIWLMKFYEKVLRQKITIK